MDEKHLGAKGEYKSVVDPRVFTEKLEHKLFKHNEHAIMTEIMANIGTNYGIWSNDGMGTLPIDGVIFLAKRMLHNYESSKNPLDIIRLVWYAICILRYGNKQK